MQKRGIVRDYGGKVGDGRGLPDATGVVKLALLMVMGLGTAAGQGPPPVVAGRALAPQPVYLSRSLVPSTAGDYLLALGDRLQRAGKERITLTGTFTDAQGTVPAQLTWEAPGRLRLNKQGTKAESLVYDDKSGVLNPSSLKAADLDVLESLLQDGPEQFLYGFARGHAYRFLGGRFRNDDGKAPGYKGPLYDVFDVIAPVAVITGNPMRRKHYYFDSETKLFVKAQYVIERGGARVRVATVYGKWTANSGQAIPGRIQRLEDGAVVFTLDIATAAIGPAMQDGLFSKP